MLKISHLIKRAKNKITGSAKPKDIFTSEFIETLEYESPYFLFNKEKIISNYRKFQKLFPGSSVHYAMKANSEIETLETLAKCGCGFEVASKYELDILKKLHISPENIVYGTSVKPAEHIKAFFEYGVKTYAFDSEPELEKIAAMAPGANVYVRTTANDSGSVFKFSEKFGADQASIIPLLVRARDLGLKPCGISFNVGSQASDPKAWANVIIGLRSIISELADMGIRLEILNLGGGYPCTYAGGAKTPELTDIAKYTLQQYKKLPYELRLVLEPGRGIVADTGSAIATVIARVERRASTWLFLDLGVYNGLFETMAYQGSTRYQINSVRPIGDSGEMLFAIAGPTGDSPDVITREALLPRDVSVGDKVIIFNCGAYSLSVTSQFNGFPKPKAYFI